MGKKEELFHRMKGQLIVSCQALPGEPFYEENFSLMDRFACAAKQAGAVMIRANGVRDIQAIKKAVELPVIGLVKREYPGYDGYITPTEREIKELLAVNADMIALDCTNRRRGDGKTVIQFMEQIRKQYPDVIFMADVAVYEEGIAAWKAGMDLVSTTMSGYTEQSLTAERPDYQLVERLSQTIPIPVLAEGRIEEPYQAAQMIQKGAYAVVVGGAITRPQQIAGRFVRAVIESERQRGADDHAE